MITLADLKKDECAVIIKINLAEKMKKHLADMGVIPGNIIIFRRKAPLGDPYLYRIMDYMLSIRRKEAGNIEVERIYND